MYERFFNLTAEPFRLTPDSHFRYQHPQWSRIKAYLAYAFRRAEGFVMVTGPPGAGKTSLINDVIEYLADEGVQVANLVSTPLAGNDLLRTIAYIFNVDSQATDKSTILQQLTTGLSKMHDEGKRPLLIVDEAHQLTIQALDELRLLTNLEQNQKPLLQIFMVGQPELREFMRNQPMEPVNQRIIAATHLKPLSESETKKYVEHRLRVAGWKSDPTISNHVFRVIYRFSDGIPRRINLICNRLLLQCFVEQSHRVTIEIARSVVEKLVDEHLTSRNLLVADVFLAEDQVEKRVQTKLLSAAPAIQSPAKHSTAKCDQPEHFFLLRRPGLQKLQPEWASDPDSGHIAASDQLKPLTEKDTQRYVESELQAIGWKNDPTFSVGVFRIIHQFGRGDPKRVNLLCNHLLLRCYVEKRRSVSVADARAKVKELSEGELVNSDRRSQKVVGPSPSGQDAFKDEVPEEAVIAKLPITDFSESSSTSANIREKARFESMDIPLATYGPDRKSSKSYAGLERRRRNRRNGADRRQEIRFEINKDDRRKNPGKRHNDITPKFW